MARSEWKWNSKVRPNNYHSIIYDTEPCWVWCELSSQPKSHHPLPGPAGREHCGKPTRRSEWKQGQQTTNTSTATSGSSAVDQDKQFKRTTGGWPVKIPSTKLICQITVGFYYMFQFNFWMLAKVPQSPFLFSCSCSFSHPFLFIYFKQGTTSTGHGIELKSCSWPVAVYDATSLSSFCSFHTLERWHRSVASVRLWKDHPFHFCFQVNSNKEQKKKKKKKWLCKVRSQLKCTGSQFAHPCHHRHIP